MVDQTATNADKIDTAADEITDSVSSQVQRIEQLREQVE